MLGLKRLFAALCLILYGGAAIAQDAPVAPAAPAAASADNILYLDLSTGGRVTILLNPSVAPAHVERIRTLAAKGFYDGLLFHRVIEGFMAQTGDPKGDGTGGSDLPDLKAEFTPTPHVRGTVSMARAGNPDSANSQFFIMLMPNFALDGKYTAFGRVIGGMEYVDAIARGEPPVTPDRILQASIGSQDRPQPAYPPRDTAANDPALSAAALNAPMR